MLHWATSISLASLLAFGVSASAQRPSADSSLGVSARVVRVDVVAEDEDGRPVRDLRREELVLSDDGREEPITSFAAPLEEPEAPPPHKELPANTFTNRLETLPAAPASVTAILFDGLNTPMANQEFAKKQVIGFLRQLPPGNRVSLYTLGLGPRVLVDFTTDTEPLVRALEQYRPERRAEAGETSLPLPDTGLERFDSWRQELSLNLVERYAKDRALRTVRSLVAIANHLERVPGRKNLIWVSGSFPVRWIARDTVPLPGPPASSEQSLGPEIERAARALASSNLAVYPVDARGLRSTGEYAPGQERISRQARFADRSGFEAMEALAERTGGRAFVNSNDLGRAFRRAVDDSRAAYILGYEPTHDAWNGEFRRIEVKTTRPGVRLRHRRGYFAQPEVPTDDGYRRGVLEAATWSPMDATRVGFTVRATPTKDDRLTLTLRLHAPDVSLRQEGDRWRGQLDVWFVQLGPADALLDTDSRTAALSLTSADHQRVVRANEIVLMERLKPKEDTVLLRILVRDVATGALGSVSIPLDQIEPASIGNASHAQPVEGARARSLSELAELYINVEREEAVAHVGVLTQPEVEAETQGLLETLEAVALAEGATRADVEQVEATLRAAAALLSDAARLALYRGDARRSRWELDNAALLVRGVRSPARGGGFARRFYLLAGLMLHGMADLAAAHEMLSEGLQIAGDDAELLLARGAVSETIAALRTYDLPDGARRPPDVLDRPGFVIEGQTGEGGPLPRVTLADAQALYSKALQRDSGLLEARLRLGRVLLLRGKPQGALPELQRVGLESSRSSQCYMARLFEGRAREQLGDLHGAAAAFAEAATLAPQAQSARVAQGRVLDRLGEGARSQEAFDWAMLREAEAQLDPWWDYMRGQPDRIKGVLEELRGQVP